MREHARALLVDTSGVVADLGAGLDRLCLTAAHELHLSGVAVTLMTGSGFQAVAGASDEHSRGLEEIQFTLGEGPGCDAFGSGRPVLIPDLDSVFVRWPGYVPAARRAGICAAYTFPLQLGAMDFGVLACYADQVRTLGATELTHCLGFAELATELLLESSSADDTDTAGTGEAGLRNALDLRTEIYQAQGMVMVALGVTLVEALARMRAQAFANGQDLIDLAVGIIDGSIELPHDVD